MRTFLIATACFIALVAWLLHKPIPKKPQVVRAFTASEIDYLEKSFDYAMESLKDGAYLDWSAAGVNGRISVGHIFEGKQKAQCRPFVEISRTYHAQKVDYGTACKRQGKEGWCRVYGENPKSCALEQMESTLTKQSRYVIMQGMQVLDDVWSKASGIDASSMIPSVPSVHAPDMPAIGVPEIDTPDLEPSDFRPPMPWDK